MTGVEATVTVEKDQIITDYDVVGRNKEDELEDWDTMEDYVSQYPWYVFFPKFPFLCLLLVLGPDLIRSNNFPTELNLTANKGLPFKETSNF
jgi:hypothetical protein